MARPVQFTRYNSVRIDPDVDDDIEAVVSNPSMGYANRAEWWRTAAVNQLRQDAVRLDNSEAPGVRLACLARLARRSDRTLDTALDLLDFYERARGHPPALVGALGAIADAVLGMPAGEEQARVAGTLLGARSYTGLLKRLEEHGSPEQTRQAQAATARLEALVQ